MNRAARGFSLVELLAVIAIIMALMTGLIHALSDHDNHSRQAARESLRSWLHASRSHAIASHRPTALLIPAFSPNHPLGGRWMAIAEIENQPDSPQPFRITRMVRRWTELPNHIFFLDQTSTGITRPTLLDGTPSITTVQQNPPIDCYTLVFAPDGRIIHPSDGIPLILALGRARPTAPGRVTVARTRDGRPQLDCLRIDRLVARARLIHPESGS